MKAPTRPALRYFGGKWRAAPHIIANFPDHVCYVEPFGGAMSVLMRKVPSFIEVYNDRYDDVVIFFQVLREQPADLIAAIDLTPFSRAEYKRAHWPAPNSDPLETARRFYVRACQGRGRAGTSADGGWRFSTSDSRSKTTVNDWNNIQYLWAVARRLKQIQIENDDALRVIARYDTPNTLFYLDPPYPLSTRTNPQQHRGYRHEYSDDDHRHLAQVLHHIEGMAIISSYESDLYTELYPDWHEITWQAYSERGIKRTEAIWISPRTQAALDAQQAILIQLPLQKDAQ